MRFSVTFLVGLLLLVVSCSEQSEPKAKPPVVDDGCIGYVIKPDGSKVCV